MNVGLAATVGHRRGGLTRVGGHRLPRPWLAWLVLTMGGVGAAAPAPVIFQSVPGRFEVAAIDATAAQAVIARAEEAWALLAPPLALPDAFSSPVFVRLVPVADWREAAAFRVIVEAGGVVSVRLRWGEAMEERVVRRALVRGLLLRAGVARHGVSGNMVAPRWLEEACLGWWQTRADPAQFDALKQETARLAPPALADVLGWSRDGEPSHARAPGAVWLLTFLQEESGRSGAWPALLNRVLGGEAPLAALAASFPGRFANDAERELWWQTGWHHVRRTRPLPTLEAADSRAALVGLTRFVFSREGRDTVVPLPDVLGRAGEPPVDVELKRRAAALNRLLPVLHPFYRNAGLALAEALGTRATGARLDAWCGAYALEWRDATDLEAATTAALDALERKSPLSSIN